MNRKLLPQKILKNRKTYFLLILFVIFLCYLFLVFHPILFQKKSSGEISLPFIFQVLASAKKDNPGKVLQASAIQPVNPNATAETKKVLNWLANLSSKTNNRVISGQHLSYDLSETSSGYQNNIVSLSNLTGKWLAMIGASFGLGASVSQISSTNQLLVNYWSQGGLITIDHHANNPWTGGSPWDLSSRNLTELITPGTAANRVWMAELDKVAAGFDQLQNSGVVVLWRPFHEMNYRECFWWDLGASGGDPQPFVAMWQQMFNYFTYQKGLNNLLWVFSPADTNPSWNNILEAYPGDQYVDILSLDLYSDSISISGDNYSKLISKNKPVGFSEVGPGSEVSGSFDNTTIINSIRSRYPKMSFFQAWHSWTGNNMALIDTQNAANLLNDSWVITRDEVDWQSQTPLTFDLDQNGRINGFDFSLLRFHWGSTNYPEGDFSQNGLIDPVDMVLFLPNWLRTI